MPQYLTVIVSFYLSNIEHESFTEVFVVGTYKLTVITSGGLEVLRTFTSKESDVLTA